MVYVSYSHRLIVDYDFIVWLSNSPQKTNLVSKMLRINQNSKEHKKKNIVILEEDFKKLCVDNIVKDKDVIRGGMAPFDVKEELGISTAGLNLEVLRLLSGVILARSKPYQTILLTTKEKKKEYLGVYLEFLRQIKNFEIKNEEEGAIILNELFSSYASEREIIR